MQQQILAVRPLNFETSGAVRTCLQETELKKARRWINNWNNALMYSLKIPCVTKYETSNALKSV